MKELFPTTQIKRLPLLGCSGGLDALIYHKCNSLKNGFDVQCHMFMLVGRNSIQAVNSICVPSFTSWQCEIEKLLRIYPYIVTNLQRISNELSLSV